MSGTRPYRSRFARFWPQQRACRGAVAVEFALIFPIFFALFYAIVAYGLVLTLNQSLTLAAEEGARAAIKDASDEARLTNAETMSKSVLTWLPSDAIKVTAKPVSCAVNSATTHCVTVTVNYDYASRPIVPALPLLGIAIPANLGATATVQY